MRLRLPDGTESTPYRGPVERPTEVERIRLPFKSLVGDGPVQQVCTPVLYTSCKFRRQVHTCDSNECETRDRDTDDFSDVNLTLSKVDRGHSLLVVKKS